MTARVALGLIPCSGFDARGAITIRAVPGSAASRFMAPAGDYVIALGGMSPKSFFEQLNICAIRTIPGEKVVVEILRDGVRVTGEAVWETVREDPRPAAAQPDDFEFENDPDAHEEQGAPEAPGPVVTSAPGPARLLRRTPESLAAGNPPLRPLAEYEQAERQRARMDRDHYLQLGASVADAEELAARPMSPDAKIREVISRMGARVATFDPGPAFDSNSASDSGSCLPPVRGDKW